MKYWLSESLVIVKIKYSRKQRCAWKELVICLVQFVKKLAIAITGVNKDDVDA